MALGQDGTLWVRHQRSVRDYADIEAPETNRPESWVVEALHRQLEGFGLATRDLSLIEALPRAGHIAVALTFL